MTIGAPPRALRVDAADAPSAGRPSVRRLAVVLAALCAVIALVHVAVADLGRALSWDEAIYVSQVRPDVEALEFSAQRARGITLVIAPPAFIGADVVLLRLWLTAVGAAGLWAAFFPWLRLIGAATLLAAVGYATTWFALLSQSEAYPNAFTALAIVSATGWALRAASPGAQRGDLLALAAAVAFAALLRPTDAVIACAAVSIGLLVGGGRSWLRTVAVMAGAGVLGSAPWLVESVVRFGGLRERVAALHRATSGAQVDGGPIVAQYLDLLDGPLQGPIEDPRISLFALLWVAAVIVLGAAGWETARRSGRLRIATTTTVVAIAMTATYVLGTDSTYLRFLLPAWAVACPLLALGAWGIGSAMERRAPSMLRVTLWAVAGLVVAGWLASQLLITSRTAAQLADSRGSAEQLGELIGERAEGGSCAVSSEYAWPQIVFHAGCDGSRLVADRDVPFAEDASYRHVYAATTSEPPPGSVLHSWHAEQLRGAGLDGWTLYTRPAGVP